MPDIKTPSPLTVNFGPRGDGSTPNDERERARRMSEGWGDKQIDGAFERAREKQGAATQRYPNILTHR